MWWPEQWGGWKNFKSATDIFQMNNWFGECRKEAKNNKSCLYTEWKQLVDETRYNQSTLIESSKIPYQRILLSSLKI